MTAYDLHPLCTLFPRLSGAEFDALRDDIAANGLRQPIVLHEGMILDGGNRYRACIEAGVEPTFADFEGGNLVSFVLSANLHRRHMSQGQQAAIVASAQDWAKAQTHGGDRNSEQSATLHFDRAEDRAAQSGASLRTQKMADKVAKADPELAKQVAHGEVSLPKAVQKVEGRAPKAKTKRAEESKPDVPASEVDALQAELTELKSQYDELLSQYKEVVADNASMAAVFEADDKLTEAIKEAKKWRDVSKIAEDRIRGLNNETAELKRLVKSWRRKAEKTAA